jgi:3-hydroxyacyl-CoA dehydrogenase
MEIRNEIPLNRNWFSGRLASLSTRLRCGSESTFAKRCNLKIGNFCIPEMSTEYIIRSDGVAVLTVNNPPVNALSNHVLNSLISNVHLLDKNPNVKAVVITGDGQAFVGGADILEFEMITRMGMKVDENILPKFADAVEGLSKTCVAAINGVALGGGLELAMACHHRVAAASAKVGLPEINLGLIPGAQGTQRLPRLVPLEVALQMLMSGAPISVDKAKKVGLIDEIVPKGKDVVEAAAKIALSRPVRKVSEIPFKTVDKIKFVGGAVDTALVQIEKLRRGSPAPEAIAKSVRAAFTAKTFQDGVKVELNEFIPLVQSIESAALRHLFFSERLAARIEDMPKPSSKAFGIKKVGIVGAGFMGGGIAMCFANRGIPVSLLDAKQEWLSNGLSTIKKNYLSSVAKRKLSEEEANKRIDLIQGTLDYNSFRDCDIVIEAVFEDMKLKKQIFSQIDAVAKPGALLCTNTSGLDINEIAASTKRPEAVVGTHFFSPAHVMRLLEVVKTKYSSPDAIHACMQMGKAIGKVSVLVGNCDGFVGNRMMGPYGAETRQLIEEGADPILVDKAVYDFGMAMGPVSLGDMVAHDLFWRMRKNIGNMRFETKVAIGPHDLTDWLCDNGRFGQKAGKGFFAYKAGEGKTVDREVYAAIEEIARRKGMKRRSISEQEIVERCIFPLINEGFKILEEGMAQRPSDVDIVYIYGYGFPPVKGGPMFYADRYVTLPKLLEALKKYDKMTAERAKANPNYPYHDYFKPSKLLVECVEKNMTLEAFWRKAQKSKKAAARL